MAKYIVISSWKRQVLPVTTLPESLARTRTGLPSAHKWNFEDSKKACFRHGAVLIKPSQNHLGRIVEVSVVDERTGRSHCIFLTVIVGLVMTLGRVELKTAGQRWRVHCSKVCHAKAERSTNFRRQLSPAALHPAFRNDLLLYLYRTGLAVKEQSQSHKALPSSTATFIGQVDRPVRPWHYKHSHPLHIPFGSRTISLREPRQHTSQRRCGYTSTC